MKPLWDKENSVGYAWEDLQAPIESPVWHSEIALRIHSAMLEVAKYPKGTMLVGIDMGLMETMPDMTDFKQVASLEADQLRTGLATGSLPETSREIAGHIRELYLDTEPRDFLSLHIYKLEL